MRKWSGILARFMERIVVRSRQATQLSIFGQTQPNPFVNVTDPDVKALCLRYLEHFGLPADNLIITTDRATFEQKLGRKIRASIGGGYVFLPRKKTHLVLIHLDRIDRSKPKSLEIVVVEELMHMADWIAGDRRRHAKHGYDRIAHRVAEVTGTTLEEVRAALIPPKRRTPRYRYRCPGCSVTMMRHRRGTWSCARCSPTFDKRFVFVLEE